MHLRLGCLNRDPPRLFVFHDVGALHLDDQRDPLVNVGASCALVASGACRHAFDKRRCSTRDL